LLREVLAEMAQHLPPRLEITRRSTSCGVQEESLFSVLVRGLDPARIEFVNDVEALVSGVLHRLLIAAPSSAIIAAPRFE
jgi:hypothetical protein